MKRQTVCVGAAVLTLGTFLGCSGRIGGDVPDDGTGTGNPGTGSGGGTKTGGGGSSNGGSGTGTGASGGNGVTTVDFTQNSSPKYYRVVRLTNAQWAAATQQILNLAAPSGLEKNFETPAVVTGAFSNNELGLGTDSNNWQDFQTAAETLAAQVTATDAALAKVYSGTDAAGFISTLGRRAYRRVLTSAEQATYLTLFNSGSTLSGSRSTFAKGASLVIRAMLQSPYFLYRTELGATGSPLNAYEMAAKISLFVRGAPPDDATLDQAAGSGKFDTADGAAALATKLLADPAATQVMRQFHGEWLHFSDISLISKMNVASYTPALNAEFVEASYRFFDNIFTQGLGLKDMLTSTSAFYGPGMAKLYGVQAPAAGQYAQSDLGAKRVGWFAQIPYLALNGMDADPNIKTDVDGEPMSILRGVTLNLDVLCATLGPPAAVIPPIPALKPGETNRQRIDTLTGTCGMACHNQMINPLGFSFENFDGMGQWRDTENGGLPIDSTGQYTFTDGTMKTWKDAASLMQVLAAEPQTHTCYAKKLSSFGLQRDIVPADMPMLTSLANASMAQGGSVKQLIVSIVKSDAFRTHGGPQ